MSKLITAETFYDERNVRDTGIPVALWANYLYPSPEPVAPAGDSDTPVVEAYINEGRWLVKCPFGCESAQVTAEVDRRFYCAGPRGCQNYAARNFTIPVVWPDPGTQAAIENLLVLRPIVFRNWFPGETLAQLALENEVRGEIR